VVHVLRLDAVRLETVMEKATIKVLLVEDDSPFVRLLQHSLAASTHFPDHPKFRLRTAHQEMEQVNHI